jgi:hypothetical protein
MCFNQSISNRRKKICRLKVMIFAMMVDAASYTIESFVGWKTITPLQRSYMQFNYLLITTCTGFSVTYTCSCKLKSCTCLTAESKPKMKTSLGNASERICFWKLQISLISWSQSGCWFGTYWQVMWDKKKFIEINKRNQITV